MSTAARPLLTLEDTFAQELSGLYEPWEPQPVAAPELLVLNEDLADELGLDPEALRTGEGARLLSGSTVQDGSRPIAQAYAGHQFGGWSPRLGDGRAALLGEIVDPAGRRRDLHLKGSGRTSFARGGDGRAAVGPMLREHLMGEAMHALGVPTTRALAVTATGEAVRRETPLPGAVLARVAASHLRVGTFQFAAASGDRDLLRRLTDYAIRRHHPDAADAENPPLALFGAVLEAQASLVAQWMLVGLIHGVMNTDNVTISGETIDYGPCAFMEAVDPRTVFSSIDQGGRYAYGHQPPVMQWNLARLAEALVPLIDDDGDRAVAAATEVLTTFPQRYAEHWRRGILRKLGIASPGDDALADDLIVLMQQQRVDLTQGFRALSSCLRGDDGPARGLYAEPAAFDAWADRWRADVTREGRDAATVADELDRVNPLYLPRNHLVEEALDAATAGDLAPYERLLGVVGAPFQAQPGFEAYERPAPPELAPHRTFCGT